MSIIGKKEIFLFWIIYKHCIELQETIQALDFLLEPKEDSKVYLNLLSYRWKYKRNIYIPLIFTY